MITPELTRPEAEAVRQALMGQRPRTAADEAATIGAYGKLIAAIDRDAFTIREEALQ
jgi:hypothetical protein